MTEFVHAEVQDAATIPPQFVYSVSFTGGGRLRSKRRNAAPLLAARSVLIAESAFTFSHRPNLEV